jgi:hypothetical protein
MREILSVKKGKGKVIEEVPKVRKDNVQYR